VSGVIAALSPGLNWNRNLVDAERLLQWHAKNDGIEPPPVLGVYGRGNVLKAISCLETLNDSDIVNLFSRTTAAKTRAFYLNIADPEGIDSVDRVVVDRHAISAALNRRGRRGGSTVERVPLGLYRWIARHYVDLASKVGLKSYQVQAIVWNSWKKDSEVF
jgi:hypothetical protein